MANCTTSGPPLTSPLLKVGLDSVSKPMKRCALRSAQAAASASSWVGARTCDKGRAAKGARFSRAALSGAWGCGGAGMGFLQDG